MPPQNSSKSNQLKGTASSVPESIVIEDVSPAIDSGRYVVKRVVGEQLVVEADIFKDGHGQIEAVLKWKSAKGRIWQETPMHHVNNDRWRASTTIDKTGDYQFTIEAWDDPFFSWLHDLERRLDGNQTSFDTELVQAKEPQEKRKRALPLNQIPKLSISWPMLSLRFHPLTRCSTR